MKHSDTAASVAAALSALTTLLCCVPMGLAAGTAIASLAMVAGTYRGWFLAASVVLLAAGIAQFVRTRQQCAARGTTSLVILGLSAALVLLVILLPQVLASLIADLLP